MSSSKTDNTGIFREDLTIERDVVVEWLKKTNGGNIFCPFAHGECCGDWCPFFFLMKSTENDNEDRWTISLYCRNFQFEIERPKSKEQGVKNKCFPIEELNIFLGVVNDKK